MPAHTSLKCQRLAGYQDDICTLVLPFHLELPARSGRAPAGTAREEETGGFIGVAAHIPATYHAVAIRDCKVE